ncbi:MAG: CHRD domain-containing protein [Balneolaceae bacterium]
MRLSKQYTIQHWSVTTLCLLFIAGFAVTSCGTDNDDDDDPIFEEYSGDFIPSSGDVSTSASGTTSAEFNTETREVEFHVEWEDLSSPVIGMHFHQDGPVIHGIEGWSEETSGSVSGMVTFSSEEAAGLAAGDVYTQIHTEDFPGGEVVAFLNKSGNSNNSSNNNNNEPPPDDY